ncbi:MAG: PAS domain S-box protein [Alphaproteobacteria bacterium]|nr:PAS domain S-box protein [Alphaproteobacteria bacterium]|tara:strand:- start:2104 stop:3951 length:1848 start_codon:yes stop_codon:yes gene_type:complete
MARTKRPTAPGPATAPPIVSASESSWLGAIIQSSSDAIISTALDGTIASWNPAAERVFGYKPEEVIGRSVRLLIPADRQQEADDILSSVKAGKTVRNHETIRLHRDERKLRIIVTISPIHDDDGKIVGASKIVRDITSQYEDQQQLQESQERFEALADNIPQLAWMANKEGLIFWYNKRWYEYTGTTLEEVKGWGWQKLHHPSHIDRVTTTIQHSWDTGEPWEETFPLRGADGKFRWFLSRALPVYDKEGELALWFGTNTDITDQKQHEEQIQFLMNEVNHRSKNMITLVQAIARQTASTHEDFMPRFSERMQSLASSQDLLVHSGWRGARVDEIVNSQLAHFKDLIGTRIFLKGPHVRLTSAAAQSLGMALHELATNAGKYGALSNDTGTVTIAWNVLRNGTGKFDITWSEEGGPPVTTPERRGFGSTVIEKMARIAFGQPVNLEFLPEGVRWHLRSIDDRVFEDDFKSEDHVPQTEEMHAPAPIVPVPQNAKQIQRILVVEDEAIIAIDVAAALEDSGYEVIGPVGSVYEALQLLDKVQCHGAVVDVDLAGETADPVAERLMKAGIPFVTVSGSSRDTAGKAYENSPFLTKPILTQRLIGHMTNLLTERAGQA